MKTLLRRAPTQEVDDTQTAKPQPTSSAVWSAGRSMASRLVTVALLLTLVAGPVALVASLWPRPAPVAVEQATPGLTADEQRAGAYAAAFVTAWLSATEEDSAGLEGFVDISAVRLGDAATAHREVQVAQIDPQTTAGLIGVVVTAFVQEPAEADEGDEPSHSWQLRAFRVVVATAPSGSMSSVGMPAPVTLPADATSVPLDYGSAVSPSDPLSSTVQEFFASFLTGAGDIARYTTPTAGIAAIAPPPYEAIELDVVTSSDEVPQQLEAGAELELLAQLRLRTADGRELPATYALTVLARDGQWEISSINPTPIPEQ